MKLTRISDVHAILAERDIRPQKSLGQNFLIDANILEIMLDTAEIKVKDGVLEIGTGLGVLTEPLARVARRVVTVEKDPRLWPLLKERLKAFPNVELICGDMMKVDHTALFRSGINKVVANLPYSVGSAILVNLVQAETPPAQLTVTLQQEVAARLTAKPGHKDFGLLTLWTQLRYDVTIRKTVSPTCFYPAPGVGSTILNLVRQERPANNCSVDNCLDRHFFYALTKFAFAHRRKQLKTILCNANIVAHSAIHPPSPERFPLRNLPTPTEAGFAKAGAASAGQDEGQADLPIKTHLTTENALKAFQELEIDPRTRPEDLSVEMWRRLAKALKQTEDCTAG